MKLTIARSIVLAATVLVCASAILLQVLPADKLMSIDSGFLAKFVRPGVIAWWLVLAQPNSFAPPSLGGIAFTAIANGALWLLAFLFIGAIGSNVVTRRWFIFAMPALASLSAAALALLASRDPIPSAVMGPFEKFVEPGVSIWWLSLGGLFHSYPKSMDGVAFSAIANAVFWTLLFGMVVLVVRMFRRLLKVPSL